MFRNSHVPVALVALVGLPSAALAQSLSTGHTTTVTSSLNAQQFLDVTAGSEAININSFTIRTNATAGAATFEVYTKAGSYVGFDGDGGAAWGSAVASGGATAIDGWVTVNLSSPITVDAGQTVGINFVSLDLGLRYNNHPTNHTFTNPDLTIFSDRVRTGTLFGGTAFVPRAFAGAVNYTFVNPGVVGACCFSDGTCSQSTTASCTTAGGLWRGHAVACASGACAAACCLPDGSCVMVNSTVCAANGGTYNAGASCHAGGCFTGSTLWNNGPVSTGEFASSGLQAPFGTTFSETQFGNNILGFGTTSTGPHLADDFRISSPGGANIATITIHAYLGGAATDPSPVTAAYARIWDGVPGAAGSNVVFGDMVTNRLATTAFGNIYRVGNNPGGSDLTRGVFASVMNVNANLPQGTYWLEIGSQVNTGAAHFSPPVSVVGVRTPDWSNGRTVSAATVTAALSDIGGVPMGAEVAFKITGTNLTGSETGACCKSDGSCEVLTLANCTAAGGVFAGAFVSCAAANCPQLGRCCFADGSCTQVFQVACTEDGGVWGGPGTLCSAGCPQPGACCFPGGGGCSLMQPASCASNGGTFQGAGVPCSTGACWTSPVLWNNGPISTGDTTSNGFTAPAPTTFSEVGLPGGTAGGSVHAGSFRLADNFQVTGGGWQVDEITTFAYLTGSASTASPFTEGFLRIWNGAPNAGGTIVFGDMTTNRLTSSTFTDTWRTFRAPVVADLFIRPIFANTLSVNTTLPPGTYWVEFATVVNGTPATAHFAPYTTFRNSGGPAVADAIQFTVANSTWAPVAAGEQEFPFIIRGGAIAPPDCYANCDGSTTAPVTNVADFTCFLQRFAAADPYANCDQSSTPPVLNVADFTCFLQQFALGCP